MLVAGYVPELYGTHGGTSGARLVRDQGAGHRLGGLVNAAFLLEIVNGGQRSFRHSTYERVSLGVNT